MNMRRFLALGAAMLLGGVVHLTNTNSATAMAVPGNSASALVEVSDDEAMVEQVKHRRYRRRHFGPRLRHRRRGHRHYYRGWYYTYPWWLHVAPAPVYGDSHVDWCLRRFRSYNPRTDQYLGYDGYYHRCKSPYSY